MVSAGLNITTLLAGSILVLCLIYYLFNLIQRERKLPPGPWGYPLLGYMPVMRNASHQSLHKLYKKYGDIYSVKLGLKNLVVLSDPTIIREAFNHSAFSGRPSSPLFRLFNGFGIINTHGRVWREERRFLLHQLIKPIEANCIEKIIQVETESLIDDILMENGKPMDLDESLTAMSTNVITSFMVSQRYYSKHPIFLRHKKINSEGFELFAKLDMVNYLGIMQYLPEVKKCMNQLKRNHDESMAFYRGIVRDRKKNYIPGDANDVLDNYMSIFFSKKDTVTNFEEQVSQVLCDLVSAGGESTKTTLHWAILYLIHYPHIYEKVREDIDRYVGQERLPQVDDKANLVYSQAVINEVLRISNVVPTTPSHAADSDVELKGYKIPKGSLIIALIYNCNTSEKYWEKPEEFVPERFIKDGKLTSPKAFIPFGKGLRSCLGDTVAINELFLVFTGLVQNFDISLPPYAGKPSLTGVPGVTLRPQSYKVCLTPRENSYVKMSRGIP